MQGAGCMMQYAGFRMHVGWLDLGFEIHGVRWRIFDAGRNDMVSGLWGMQCGTFAFRCMCLVFSALYASSSTPGDL